MQSIITRETLVPLGAIAFIFGAAFSIGAIYNKVDVLSDEVALMRADQKEANTKLDQLIGAQQAAYGPFPDDTISSLVLSQ